MFLRDLGASLLRRWYLVVIGIGATVGLSFLAADQIQPTYESKASLVLVPPATTVGKTGNPYLFLGGLQQSTDILARAMNSDNVHRNVTLTAPTGEYVVETDLGTSAPIIQLTATDATSAGAQRMLDATVEQVPITFQKLQRSLGVRTGALITTDVVTSFDKPKPIQAVRYRTIVLVTVASLGVFFMLIGLIDGLLLRRRARKAIAAEAGDEDLEVEASAPVVDEPEPESLPVPRPARKRAPRKTPVVTAATSEEIDVEEVAVEEDVPVVDVATPDPVADEAEADTKGPAPRRPVKAHQPVKKVRGRKAKLATAAASEVVALEEQPPVDDEVVPEVEAQAPAVDDNAEEVTPVVNGVEPETANAHQLTKAHQPVKANQPVKKVRGRKAKVGASAAVNDERSTVEGTDERNSRGDIGD